MTAQANNVFVLGEVKFELDPKDLLKSLEALDKQDTQAWKKMADSLQLPTVPFDKKLLKPVLMGEVQNDWYAKFSDNGVPEKCQLFQTARIERYKAQLTELNSNDGTDVVLGRPRKAVNGEKKDREANLYRLVDAKKEVWGGFKGQKYLIVKVMTEAGAVGPDGKGVSVRFIADTVRDTPETKAPSDKNCAFHINAFGHEGIIERVEERDGKWIVSEVQKKSTEAAPEPKKNPEPAPEQKKEEAKKPAGKPKSNKK